MGILKKLKRKLVKHIFKPIKKAIDHNRWMNINAQYIHLLRVTPKLVKLADFGLTEDEWAGYVDDQLAALKEKRMSANGISVRRSSRAIGRQPNRNLTTSTCTPWRLRWRSVTLSLPRP